jgi:hypothetical protein
MSHLLNFCLGSDVISDVESNDLPFVPRQSDIVKIDGAKYRVLSVEVQYIHKHFRRTEITVYLEKA